MFSHALGPYRLLEPLASGGMGSVWRGMHARSGLPVAIKVVSSQDAREPKAVASFQAEVRAVAALDHPHIARIFDYGLLPEQLGAIGAGELVPGSPYLVMELCEGGDLRRWVSRAPGWAVLQQALLELLDALAHAHARGVIHRDLKPGNVLHRKRKYPSSGVVLADFGLAMRADEQGHVPAGAGTPSYMAPEQRRGDRSALGPWTDLYGLGAFCWAVLQGAPPPPFEPGEDPAMAWDPPRVVAPAGLRAWLAHMLNPSPERRLRVAAEAAWLLRDLVDLDAPDTMNLEGVTIEFDEPTSSRTWDGASARSLSAPHAGSAPGAEPTASSSAERRSPAVIRDFPQDWRAERPAPPPLALLDAGLGLHGLREPTLVGRDAERDRLWAALGRACADQRAAAVVLEGPMGFGRTRLAAWLAERAAELGVAKVARASFGPSDSPGQGLDAMLRRALDADGLPARPHPAVEEGPAERHDRVLRGLYELAGERALLVVLDDVAWGADGIGLALTALQSPRHAERPTLLVLCAQREALARRPVEAAQLAQLQALPGVQTVEVGPLAEADHGRLVDGSLRLAPGLRETLARRAAGNPLFVSLLVGDWVRRGLLEVGAAGFQLMDGARADLPASLDWLIQSQVEWLRQDRPREDMIAVEIACTLGLEVDRAEWATALALAKVRPSPGLDDLLVHHQIARLGSSAGSWAFVSAILREGLLLGAGARAAEHHLVCARALEAQRGEQAELRVARHRILGGEAQGGLALAIRAARRLAGYSLYDQLAGCVLLIDEALAAGARPDPEQEAWLTALRGVHTRFGEGRMDAAVPHFERAFTLAMEAGMTALASEMRRRLGGIRFTRGEPEGLALIEAALALARTCDDPLPQIEAHRDLSTVLKHGGKIDEAARHIQEAIALAERTGQVRSLPRLWLIQANVLCALERHAEALLVLERAIAELSEGASRLMLASALNTMGVCHFRLGNIDVCIRYYERARALFDGVCSDHVALPIYNLASAFEQRGARDEARSLVLEGLNLSLRHTSRLMETYCRALLAQIEASAGRWEVLGAQLDALEGLLASNVFRDETVQLNLTLIIKASESQGQHAVAERARRLKVDQRPSQAAQDSG